MDKDLQPDNIELYENAVNAINKLFNDRSVSKKIAINNLKELICEIETMIESLED